MYILAALIALYTQFMDRGAYPMEVIWIGKEDCSSYPLDSELIYRFEYRRGEHYGNIPELVIRGYRITDSNSRLGSTLSFYNLSIF